MQLKALIYNLINNCRDLEVSFSETKVILFFRSKNELGQKVKNT